MKQGKYTIYKLTDPRTNEVKYIGQTTVVLWRRLSAHVSPNSHKTEKFKAWVDDVVASGNRPVISPVANADNREAAGVIESGMIIFYRKLGANLCNTNADNAKANTIINSNEPKTEAEASAVLMKLATVDDAKILRELPTINFLSRSRKQ